MRKEGVWSNGKEAEAVSGGRVRYCMGVSLLFCIVEVYLKNKTAAKNKLCPKRGMTLPSVTRGKFSL